MDAISPATATSGLDSFARRQTHERWRVLRSEIERAAADPGEEAIHDVRVAIRRLSTALQLFRFAYDRKACKSVRRQLRDLRRLAGEVRDRDIAIGLARRVGFRKSHPIPKKWRNERAKAATALIAALRKVEAAEGAERWREELSKQGQGGDAGLWHPSEPAADNAARVLPQLARDLFSFGRESMQPDCAPEILHEVRLRAKGLRYAVELFHSMYGSGIDNRIVALRELQDHLGDFNDAVVAVERVRQTVKRGTKGRKKLLRAFERLRDKRGAAAIVHWHETFDGPGRRRWWLTYLRRPRAGLSAKPLHRAGGSASAAIPALAVPAAEL